MHKGIKISDNAKKAPETVSCYNETKCGVDIVDQMAKKYTVRSGTRRWPVHSFQNTLDLAAINTWILYKELTKENIARREFIHKLAEELAESSVQNQTTFPLKDPSPKIKHARKNSAKLKFPARETALLACVLNVTNLYVELAPTTFNVYAKSVLNDATD